MSSVFEKLAAYISDIGENLIIIDGMSASGKTTLANKLSQILNCDVIHIDDFYLPKEKQRKSIAGNIDAERFCTQVTDNLGKEILYGKYDCQSGTYSKPVKIRGGRVIIEGAYALHESLNLKGGLKIFMEIGEQEQKRRIIAREKFPQRFFEIWIPKEEEYFKACKIRQNCDIKLYENEWK